jgi:hypothetical protein
MVGMWNYAPMQFDDFSILYIVHEEPDGKRPMEEAIRIWSDPAREPEWLGRPEFEHTLVPGTRMISEPSRLSFPHAPGGAIEVKVVPLTHAFIAVGTGYGMDADWRPRHVPGSRSVVQGKEMDDGGARVVGVVRRGGPRGALRALGTRRRAPRGLRTARARLLRVVSKIRTLIAYGLRSAEARLGSPIGAVGARDPDRRPRMNEP